MKNIATISSALFLVSLCWPGIIRAEQVTLQEALQAALANRPLVQAQAAEREAAAANQAAASSRYLPRLSLNEQFYATNEPGGSLFISLNQQRLKLSPTADAYNEPPSRKDFETRLTLNQQLFDTDRRFQSKRAAVLSEAAGASARQGQAVAALDVIEAYLDVQQGDANVKRAATALHEAEEVLSVTRQRTEAGTGLKAETLRAQTRVHDAQLGLLTAQHAQQLARHRLAFSMGRAEGEVDIDTPLKLAALPEPAGNNQLQRGDLQALRLQSREANLATRQARATFLPKADLQASYILHDETTPFGSDADAWSVMAGLRWEFFDGFERNHRQASATARHKAATARTEEQVRQAQLALITARLKAEQAQLAVIMATSAHQAAEEARQVMLDRYQAGLASLTDLLAVQAELEHARHARIAAETGQIKARAMTHFQQGTLLEALSLSEEEAPR